MARQRQRACLQEGLHLRIHSLIRQRLLLPGIDTAPTLIRWSFICTQEEIARGLISAKFFRPDFGIATITLGDNSQMLELIASPRHFGGRQWYFRCPVTARRSAVLWLPPGATRFASRQTWGRQVAYASQFRTPYDRALMNAQNIRLALGGPDWISIDEMMPPKPKGMRWPTYEHLTANCARYEDIADTRLTILMGRWLKLT